MDKISGYIVANGQGGYDVVEKISPISTKPFTIPFWDEDIGKTDNIPKTDTNKNRDFTHIEYDLFKDIAETGNFKVPGYIHTKTEPARSDEEILKDIEKLAKEHAKTGQDRSNDQKFLKLMDEYISSVSPDRAGILNHSVNEIYGRLHGEDYSISAAFQQIDSQRTYKTDEEYKEKEKEKELIDYLLERLENKGKNNNVSTDIYGNENGERNTNIKSDMYETFVQNGAIQYVHFFDPNSESKGNECRFDESVMMYSGQTGTLAQQLTKEELSRKQEVYATYDSAYNVTTGLTSGSVA